MFTCIYINCWTVKRLLYSIIKSTKEEVWMCVTEPMKPKQEYNHLKVRCIYNRLYVLFFILFCFLLFIFSIYNEYTIGCIQFFIFFILIIAFI